MTIKCLTEYWTKNILGDVSTHDERPTGGRKRAGRCDLRTARKRAGLTQEQLAKKAGVRQGMVSKLESGHIRNPRFSTVLSLARALERDPETLRFEARDGNAA